MSEATNAPLISERASRSARLHSYVHRYKNQLRKHWWIPVLTILLGLGIQGFRLWRVPPTYSSFGQLILNFRVSTPGGVMSSITEEGGGSFLPTQVALLQSDTVRSSAVERVRALHPVLVPSYTALKIIVPPRTTIFNCIATGSEPAYTQAFLDGCMDEFVDLKRRMKETVADKTLSGIQDELIRLQREIKNSDDELLNFQSSNSVIVLQEQGGKASSYLVTLDNQLEKLKTDYALIQSLTLDQNLERQRNSGDNSTSGSDLNGSQEATALLKGPGAEYLRQKQLIQLKKADQKELSEFLRPKHPKMIALNDEISRAEKLLSILREQSIEQLDNNRSFIELNIKNLETQIVEWKTKSLEISRQVAQYTKIKTENERNKKNYDNLLANMQAIGVTKGAEAETVTIFKRATPAERNIPDLFRYLMLGVLAGLALGGGILFILDRLDDRPTTFTELQDSFDEPVLGQIPQEQSFGKNGAVKLLQPGDNRHAFVEAYRNLRSSLLYMATEGRRAKTIIVTSAIPGDGKSMTTANMAITLAESGARVLLIDADLRKGYLHRQFGVNSDSGLTEVLNQQVEWSHAVVPTHIPTLSLIPRGTISKNPGELFLKTSTHRLLTEVAGHYDYVIIDSAPVMAADDVTSLSPHIEGVIFVIRSGYTSTRIAHAALDLLYQRDVNVLGLVFNGVQAEGSEYYFYKYKDYHATPQKG